MGEYLNLQSANLLSRSLSLSLSLYLSLSEERIRALRGGEATPTAVYKVVKELAAGVGQSKPVLASLFRKVDGSMASIEENAKTVQEHFTRVYDAPLTIDLAALD